jgi:hypothetical protein
MLDSFTLPFSLISLIKKLFFKLNSYSFNHTWILIDKESIWFFLVQVKTLTASHLPCSPACYSPLWVFRNLVVRDPSGFSYFVHRSVFEDVNDTTKHQTLWNTLVQWGGDEETSLKLTDCFIPSRYKETLARESDGDSKLNHEAIYEDVGVNCVKDRAVIKAPG